MAAKVINPCSHPIHCSACRGEIEYLRGNASNSNEIEKLREDNQELLRSKNKLQNELAELQNEMQRLKRDKEKNTSLEFDWKKVQEDILRLKADKERNAPIQDVWKKMEEYIIKLKKMEEDIVELKADQANNAVIQNEWKEIREDIIQLKADKERNAAIQDDWANVQVEITQLKAEAEHNAAVYHSFKKLLKDVNQVKVAKGSDPDFEDNWKQMNMEDDWENMQAQTEDENKDYSLITDDGVTNEHDFEQILQNRSKRGVGIKRICSEYENSMRSFLNSLQNVWKLKFLKMLEVYWEMCENHNSEMKEKRKKIMDGDESTLVTSELVDKIERDENGQYQRILTDISKYITAITKAVNYLDNCD